MSNSSAYRNSLIGVQASSLLIFIVFLAYYIKRIHKLDRLASNNDLTNIKSLKFRIALISILIALQLLHVILSFADSKYWLFSYSAFSLVQCVSMLDLFLQIYIITRQRKKKSHSSRSLITLWVFMMLISIGTIAIVEHFDPNPGVAVEILQLAVELALVIVTGVTSTSKPTDSIESLQETFRQTSLLPLMHEGRDQSDKKKIYIEFNRQFQIKMQGVHAECSFKIAVYVGDESHIISKSQKDFTELSKLLVEAFPNSDSAQLRMHAFSASNFLKYGEEIQKLLENYLLDITSNPEFYIEPLMNFLAIPTSKRDLLQRNSRLRKKDTLSSEDQDKLNQPFFEVFIKEGRIWVSNSQILQLIMNKSPSEIRKFHDRLLEQKHLKIEYISEEGDESELVHFIDSVVNCKQLWRSFAEWMCLGINLEDKIYNMFDFWKLGFRHIDMSIIGHEISFDREGTIIFYYLLSLRKKNSQTEAITLKKRFNDFVKLDKAIHKFVEKVGLKNAHLPSLPPKFSPFGNKTSPKARQVYFDSYIKQLIKIEGINHCIKLLEFMEVQNAPLANESYQFEESGTPSPKVLESGQFEELELEAIN